MTRQTSAECFHSTSFQSQAATERDRVLTYLIRRAGPATRREVAADLHMERGSVSRAVCELMAGGDSPVVELDGLHQCPITGRRVNWICAREYAEGMQWGLAV